MQSNPVHPFMKSILAINIFTIMAAEFLVPLWSKFAEYIGGDMRTAGIAVSIFSIIIGTIIIVAGRIQHHIKNEEKMMLITTTLMSVGYIGYFFVHHPWQLYAVQAFLGVCSAFQCAAIYSLYGQYMPRQLSAWHWSLWNGTYFIAFGAAALLAGFIAHHFTFNAVFATLLFFSLISLALCIIIMPKVKQFRQAQPR